MIPSSVSWDIGVFCDSMGCDCSFSLSHRFCFLPASTIVPATFKPEVLTLPWVGIILTRLMLNGWLGGFGRGDSEPQG